MIPTVLALTLSLASLVPDDEVATAAVERLSLDQLDDEATRLSEPPSLVGAKVLLGFGVPMVLGGIGFTIAVTEKYGGKSDWGATVLLVCLDFLTVFVSAGGAAMAIVGGVMMRDKLRQGEALQARLKKVKHRLDALESGKDVPPLDEPLPAAPPPAASRLPPAPVLLTWTWAL